MTRTICTTFVAFALIALHGIAHACTPYGLIGSKYSQLGQQSSPLGACVDDEHDDGAGGRIEDFQNGQIDWDGHSNTAFAVWGIVDSKWSSLGGATWGHPTQDLTVTPDGKGTYGWFRSNAGGVTTIYDNPHSYYCQSEGMCLAYVVYGAILSEWAALSYERGQLGYPESDEQAYNQYGGVAGERVSLFDNGFIRWRPDGSILAKLETGRCLMNTGSYVTDQQHGIIWCP
jgi:uncharacterized protein with LGFP repeats